MRLYSQQLRVHFKLVCLREWCKQWVITLPTCLQPEQKFVLAEIGASATQILVSWGSTYNVLREILRKDITMKLKRECTLIERKSMRPGSCLDIDDSGHG